MKQCGAVILAAGHSLRMGRPKLSLPMGDGSSFLSHILSRYKVLKCSPLVVVVNPEGEKTVAVVLKDFSHDVVVTVNQHPEKGRFHSLQIALAGFGQEQAVFIHNVDNPFVNFVLLYEMMQNGVNADFVSPCCGQSGGHPLLLMPSAIKAILDVQEPYPRLDAFLRNYRKQVVNTTDPNIHFNVNTPEDYQEFLSMLK